MPLINHPYSVIVTGIGGTGVTPTLTLPLSAGRPALGTWQGIFLFVSRQQECGLQVSKPSGHHQVIGGEFQPDPARRTISQVSRQFSKRCGR